MLYKLNLIKLLSYFHAFQTAHSSLQYNGRPSSSQQCKEWRRVVFSQVRRHLTHISNISVRLILTCEQLGVRFRAVLGLSDLPDILRTEALFLGLCSGKAI
jgi:hypothetical protein